MDKKIEAKIKSAVRQIWRFYSEERREALKATSCAYCKAPRQRGEKYDCDHVQPIVPTTGWDSWDGYLNRLFTGLVVGICKKCHAKKTRLENAKKKGKKEKMTVIGFARIGRWLDIDWNCEFCDHENSSIIYDNQKTMHCPHCKKLHVLWK